MTLEELAKLKKGDKLGWHGDVVTLDRVQAVVLDKGREVHLNLEFLRVIPGPTLPPHVAEIWDWDSEPKGLKREAGWVWRNGWDWPKHGTHFNDAYRLIRKRCACQKEDK